MRIPISRLLAAAGLVLAASLGLDAAGARFWHISTQAEFLKGEVENLSIDQHGRLVLGPQTTLVGETATPFVWRIVPAPGGGVFAGSGNDGQVFRFAPDGTRTVVFDAPEVAVHALAAGPNGVLYVGTSPDGRIYRIDASGASTVYFDPADKYIWSLALDATGVLYAATGEKGLIYRIPAEGKGEVFYETRSTHAMTLLFDRNGDLLAGTQAPGRVFRIRPDRTGFVLLDPGLEEIGTLRLDEKGVIYAAGFTGRPPGPPDRPSQAPSPAPEQAPQPVATVTTEITAVAVVDVPATSGTTPAPRAERRAVRGGVYRITPDGAWDAVWESTEDVPYDVLPEPNGAVLVATGHTGKVYRLEGEPVRITLLARADAQQVTGLLRQAGGEVWFATSNPGKVFRMSGQPAQRGTYTSDVRDAETVATWGAISWRGTAPQGSTVRLFTRTGNTAVPDDTWSAWSDAYTRPDGQGITSPRARYLQWRLELTGTTKASPLVTSVMAAYLQRNARPQVSSITVHPPGVVFQKPFSTGDTEIAGFDGTAAERRAAAMASGAAAAAGAGAPVPAGPTLGRRTYQKGLQTFIWRAEDANDDELRYDVFYRREGETAWKPLRRGLEDAIYVWDTTAVPNGTYVVKIAASDAPSNPPATALVGERESRAFDIDNSAPAITVTRVTRTAERTVVEFVVEDDHSPVHRVEYSLDADRWRPAYPKDGIADSRREEFELVIEGETAGRAIILRAIDTMNNVVTTRADEPGTRAGR
jgi:hypothetical protein